MKNNTRESNMRKISRFCIIVAITVSIFFVSACGNTKQNIESPGKSEEGNTPQIQIVTTVFPLYDWTKAVVGDDPDFQVILLAESGVDFHSFQPSTEDIMKIKKSDVFLYIGGVSDQWVSKVIEEQGSNDGENISMVSALGDRVKSEDEELELGADSYNHEHQGGKTHEEEIDEHLWLSLKNAKIYVEKICQVLSDRYPEKKDVFNENCSAYVQKLDQLDEQYQDAANSGSHKAVIVGDRFPFRYLLDDYGIQYFAAFPGCSSESEGSFEKIIWLAQKADQLNVNKIIAIEGSTQTICNSIIENTEKKDQSVVVMNSMQQVSMKDIEGGENYLKIMEENLEALKEALN